MEIVAAKNDGGAVVVHCGGSDGIVALKQRRKAFVPSNLSEFPCVS